MLYQVFSTQIVCPKDQLPYFTVTNVIHELLGESNAPLPVCGDVEGLAYRGVLWPEADGQRWNVELAPELAMSGRFTDGIPVMVTMALDKEPREATIPYELTETLGMAALAERAWEKLSEIERAPFCEWVNAATESKERWSRAERAAVLVRRGEKLEMDGHSGV